MIGKGGSKIGNNKKSEVKNGREVNMKTLAIVLLLCLGAFLVMGIGMAYAAGEDTEVQTSAVSLTIPHEAVLDIADSASSKELLQDAAATETDFDRNFTDMPVNTPKLKVSANKNWKLSAKSSGFALVGGTYTKAIGDLQLKHSGLYVAGSFASFTSLSGVDQDIATNATGVKDEPYNCQYGIKLDWTKDVPGTYTATVTYTLVTQA